MKTLFATDLDGTFLNSQERVSPYTRNIIEKKIAEGMLFTVATARKVYSSLEVLEGLTLSAPMILGNGAYVYDSQAHVYLYHQGISQSKAEELIQLLEEFPVCAKMTVFDGKQPRVFSQLPEIPPLSERKGSLLPPPAVHTPTLSKGLEEGEAISFVIVGSFSSLEPICRRLEQDGTFWWCCYENTYVPREFWLEICSSNVSKAEGLRFVKEYVGATHLVAFGDNLNDIEMLSMAEEGYCVANAVAKAKEVADGILPYTNEQDGVARFLENYPIEKWR